MSALQRILIASPVRQSPNVLKAFLSSLSSLSIREDEIEVSYVFIDDNEVQASSKQLRAFVRKHGGRVVKAKAIEKPKKNSDPAEPSRSSICISKCRRYGRYSGDVDSRDATDRNIQGGGINLQFTGIHCDRFNRRG